MTTGLGPQVLSILLGIPGTRCSTKLQMSIHANLENYFSYSYLGALRLEGG